MTASTVCCILEMCLRHTQSFETHCLLALRVLVVDEPCQITPYLSEKDGISISVKRAFGFVFSKKDAATVTMSVESLVVLVEHLIYLSEKDAVTVAMLPQSPCLLNPLLFLLSTRFSSPRRMLSH